MISKVVENLVNNTCVDHLEKSVLFTNFQYGFRSSSSTADLLTVVSNRIARAFNRSGATQAVLSTGFGMLVFFAKVSPKEFQVRYLVLFCASP